MRNLTISGAVTAIQQLWDWGWTYKGVTIDNCGNGFNFTAESKGALGVGSVVIIDSTISNTPVGISYGNTVSGNNPSHANNLILENVNLKNVSVGVESASSGTLLAGTSGTLNIAGWGRGNTYTATTGPTPIEGSITPNSRPPSLVSGTDYYEQSAPTYSELPSSQFLSVMTAGAAGDGSTDDTIPINNFLAAAAAANKIAYFDAGIYKVTGTIKVPAGSRIYGEAFPVIMSSGSFFSNIASPQPVVQVGQPNESGHVEWTNMIVSTQGSQGGAILIEWNLNSPSSAPSGLWEVHTRIGGFKGSNLQVAECVKQPGTQVNSGNLKSACVAAFASMHITKTASGLYVENSWLWVADHDVEDAMNTQITIYAGRGLLIESTSGAIWLVGTAVEHHTLYQYQFSHTQAIFAGQIQTESPYYQPNPDARIPFPTNSLYNDPVYHSGATAWGVRVVASSEVFVYGAGLYSFFDNYDVSCSAATSATRCQSHIVSIDQQSHVSLYNLNTVGVAKMITVNNNDIASYTDNNDGFVASLAMFRN